MRRAPLIVLALAPLLTAAQCASGGMGGLGLLAGGAVGHQVIGSQVRSGTASVASLGTCNTPEARQARQMQSDVERLYNANDDVATTVALSQLSSLVKSAQASCNIQVAAAPPAPAPAAAAAAKPADPVYTVKKGVVAVMPVDAKDIEQKLKDLLEEEIRTVSGDRLGAKGMTVLTGETTLSILAENGVDAAKACEASCALQAARELKAKLFISGTAAFAEGEYTAFVRVFESESGKQVGSIKLEGKTVRDLRNEFEAKAGQLFDRIKVVD